LVVSSDGEGPEMPTGMFATGASCSFLTWTASVPWFAPNEPTRGATRLVISTGLTRVPATLDVTFAVIRM
jgi:hypothetical protein